LQFFHDHRAGSEVDYHLRLGGARGFRSREQAWSRETRRTWKAANYAGRARRRCAISLSWRCDGAMPIGGRVGQELRRRYQRQQQRQGIEPNAPPRLWQARKV